MNFDQLETFLMIAKINNFSRAASELNISQPAVTARITSLEKELNCKLFSFEKNKRPVLTKEGKLFLNYARKLVTDMYDAKQALNLSQKPRINLGFTPNFSAEIISETIKSLTFEEAFLSVRRGSSSCELVELTLKNELALSFVYNPVMETNLIVENITPVGYVILLSREHPLAKEEKIKKELLCNETMVCYSRNTNLWRSIEEKLKNLDLNKIEIYDIELVKKLVFNKVGFAILPEMSINKYDEKELCIKPFDLLDDLSTHFCAIYKEDVIHDPFLHNIISSTINKVKSLVVA